MVRRRKRKAWVAATVASGFLLVGAGATAQSGLQTISVGQSLRGALTPTTPHAPDASRYDCYALNASAGQSVSLTLSSAAFTPKLSIGRGASCSGASFQFVKTGPTEAQVTFKPAPGRYMVMVQASDGKLGAYALTSEGSGRIQVSEASGPSRREIMEAQVGRRRAEVAEEERVRAEEQRRQAEARQAELERIRQMEEEAQIARDLEESEAAAEEAARPRVDPMTSFVNTFNSEMQKNAQERARQQAMLDGIAAQQRQAERTRQERAELARHQAEERAAQSRQLAAANAAQRQAAAEALARQQREAQLAQNRRLEQQRLAQQQAAQQRQDQIAQQASRPPPVSRPASGGYSPASGTGQASTRPDPMQCVTRHSVSRGTLCPNSTLNVSVVNGCPEPVTIKLCLKTTDGRWECGRGTKNPQESYSHPVCNATSEAFIGAVYRDRGGPMPNPQ